MMVLAMHTLGHDSGACLYRDGHLLCSVETERITRVKHDHQVRVAVSYVLDHTGTTPEDLDLIVFSTNIRRAVARIPDQDAVEARIRSGELHVETTSEMFGSAQPCLVVAHEASHAVMGLHVAGWPDPCGVLVNEGRGTFSRNAFLTYRQGALILNDINALPWYGSGFGWSALGYLLGFGDSPSVAGRVMAMGGYGQHSTGAHDVMSGMDRHFYLDRADYRRGIQPLLDYLDTTKTFADRADLIHTFQRLFSSTVAEYCAEQLAATHTDSLVLSGGCALNLDANSVIRDTVTPRVFVPPNCNDSGQAMGAAVYALKIHLGIDPEPFDVYSCGVPISSASASAVASEAGLVSAGEDPDAVAAQLAEGRVVGLAYGVAEAGPRALGNRSLLASADANGMKQRVSESIKKREWFRPLACIMREERFGELFPKQALSPYMLFNYHMPAGLAPEATHVDGTSRVQTVSRATNRYVHEILECYERRTGLPSLINTSLNGHEKAIALDSANVVDDFLGEDVDDFALAGTLYRRR